MVMELESAWFAEGHCFAPVFAERELRFTGIVALHFRSRLLGMISKCYLTRDVILLDKRHRIAQFRRDSTRHSHTIAYHNFMVFA